MRAVTEASRLFLPGVTNLQLQKPVDAHALRCLEERVPPDDASSLPPATLHASHASALADDSHEVFTRSPRARYIRRLMRTFTLVSVLLAGFASAASAPANKAPSVKTKPLPAAPVAPPVELQPEPVATPPPPRPVDPTPTPPPPAAPTSERDGSKPRLTVLDLSASSGVDPEIARSLSEAITVEAGRIGTFEVGSQKDLATILGLERQKQLLGCGEETSSCLMELADAAGARFVLTGSLVKLGNTWQLNLQTLDTRRAAPVGRSTRLASDLETIRAQLPFALAEATATPAPLAPSRVVPYTLMIAGGVGVLAAGVLGLQAYSREQASVAELQVQGATLRTAEYYTNEKRAVDSLRLATLVSAGVGAALVIVGVVLNPRSDAVVRVAVVPSVGGAAVAGVFP